MINPLHAVPSLIARPSNEFKVKGEPLVSKVKDVSEAVHSTTYHKAQPQDTEQPRQVIYTPKGQIKTL